MEEGRSARLFSVCGDADLLRRSWPNRNWPLFYLTGATENRGELIRNFQSTDGPPFPDLGSKPGALV